MGSKETRAGGAYVELGVRDKIDAALKSIRGKLNSFAKGTAAIGAGLTAGGAALVGPLLAAANTFAEVGAPLKDVADRTGVAASKLSELSFAANQSGTSIGAVEKGLNKMAKVLYSADEESKNAVDSLGDLGLNIKALRDMKPDQQFEAIADALSRVEDPSKRSALAMQIFGGAGAELLPLLAGGSKGLADMAAEAHRLGVALDDDAIEAAAGLDDAMVAFWDTVKGVTVSIGAAVAGPLTSFLSVVSGIVGAVSNWIAANGWVVQLVGAVGLGLLALGGVLGSIAVASVTLSAAIGGIGAALSFLGTVAAAVGAFLASPFGLAAIAIAGVVAALATFTNVFDPVLNWLGAGFSWLVDVVGETVGGITAALSTGDIAQAALIAFTGLRLVVGQIMESVLSLFGSSIQRMSELLAWLYKQIGTVLSRLNEARAQSSQWLAQGIGYLAGVQVLDGDNADLQAARAWSQSWDAVDVSALAKGIETALDPQAIQKELDSLVFEAKAKAEDQARQAAAAPEFKGIDPTTVERSAAATLKSFGGFSVANLNRQTATQRDFQKDTAANTAATVQKLAEVVKILPSITPRFS